MSHFLRPQWRQYLEYGQGIVKVVKYDFLQRGHGQKECQYENAINSGMIANMAPKINHSGQGTKPSDALATTNSRKNPNHKAMPMTNPLRILR